MLWVPARIDSLRQFHQELTKYIYFHEKLGDSQKLSSLILHYYSILIPCTCLFSGQVNTCWDKLILSIFLYAWKSTKFWFFHSLVFPCRSVHQIRRVFDDNSRIIYLISKWKHIVTPPQKCLCELILMRVSAEIWRIIPRLSLLPHLTWSTGR